MIPLPQPARIPGQERLRILVTGGTGLLGSALLHAGQLAHEMVGLARNPGPSGLSAMFAADISDARTLDETLAAVAPQVVIHAAALCSVDLCERNPEAAFRVNVQGTANLLEALRRTPARLVHISTDSVFDGRCGCYAEDDVPAPLNVYARTKLQAEELVLSRAPEALVLRTVFYGPDATSRQGLLGWILGRLTRGETVSAFTDSRFSPICTEHLAAAIVELAVGPASGILHLAGSQGCSKYDFALAVAQGFGHPVDLVRPTNLASVNLAAPRPLDVTLSVRRAEALLGRKLPRLNEGIRTVAATAQASEPATNRANA